MQKYSPEKIELKWRKVWEQKKTFRADLKRAKNPYYNLMMFPYPSAEGLHVGNVYAFTGSDIHGRFRRMQRYDVFEPMGFDAFGIHSENFAIKKGVHPKTLVGRSVNHFKKQLKSLGCLFDWAHEVNTTDPAYYKWTQWLFLQLFKAGLAYRAKAPVDWCPSCKTVLADEQVIQGKCERCDSDVVQKELEQWFFKITKYADRLLKNLEIIDWSERTKIAQGNWIGRSEGSQIEFKIQNSKFKIPVFTTRPDTLFGATYVVLAPEHQLIENLKFKIENWNEVERYISTVKKKSELERMELEKEKTGVELRGIKAVNPANGEELPVFLADYVLAGYGAGAVMAVPAHDQRDFEFAGKYNLPIRFVIFPGYRYAVDLTKISREKARQIIEEEKNFGFGLIEINGGLELFKPADDQIDVTPILKKLNQKTSGYSFSTDVQFFKTNEPYLGFGTLKASGRFNGLFSEVAKWEIVKSVVGQRTSKYHLRDWLISRQRYWGPPIPIIYCDKCGIVPVPEKDLPVLLPYVKEFRPTGTGESPLASVEKFVKTSCPQCEGDARRETDVSDTFLDSSWYFFRYPSVGFRNSKFLIHNSKQTQNIKSEITELPWNVEIIQKWLPVNMYIGGQEHAVLHLLYTRFITMALKDMSFVDFEEPFKKFRAHGLITKGGAKMSKSRGNVVNPDDYYKQYGADTLRMYLMFLGPFEHGGDWNDQGIIGISRFLNRVWNFVQEWNLSAQKIKNQKSKIKNTDQKSKLDELEILRHKTIKRVTEDMENLRYNTAIAALMEYLNRFPISNFQFSIKYAETLLLLLAPFAPHITEELWRELGNKTSIHNEHWPKWDEKYLKEEKATIIVQVNGRVRDQIEIKKGSTEEEIRQVALAQEKVVKWTEGKSPQKVIFVRDRLINFVV